MSLHPIYEGDPLEKKLKTIWQNLGEAKSFSYPSDLASEYTEALEFAVRIEDAEVRKRFVSIAASLRGERNRKAEAHKAVGIVEEQLRVLMVAVEAVKKKAE